MPDYQKLYELAKQQLADKAKELETERANHAEFVKQVLQAAQVTNATIANVKDVLNRTIVGLDDAKLIVQQAQPVPKTTPETDTPKKAQ